LTAAGIQAQPNSTPPSSTPPETGGETGYGFHSPETGGEINRKVSANRLPYPSVRSRLNWEHARTASDAGSAVERKSTPQRKQPFFKSLLLPGWGQLSEGNRFKAYAFFAVEATLITSLTAFQIYKGWLEDDYRAFARQHAGISGDKDHQYYVDIGNWLNNDDFNQQRLRNRQFDQLYTDFSDSWCWDSDENRLHFKSVRIDADRAGQKSLIVVGALILNHLFSAVDASGKSNSNSGKVTLESHQDGGISVGLNYRF